MGPASTQRKNPSRFKNAMQMLGKGYADVVIVDLAEDGKDRYASRGIFAPFFWTKSNTFGQKVIRLAHCSENRKAPGGGRAECQGVNAR